MEASSDRSRPRWASRSALSLACVAALASWAPAQSSPNLVLILADDLGFGDLGPYDHDQDPGTPDVTNTPVLDALASEGVSMTHFYANSPVCSPSRVALLTGRHSIRDGITHAIPPGAPQGLPAWELTIPELLAPLGYRSSIIGKWHCGSAPEYWPRLHGFDEFYGVLSSNNSLPLELVRDSTVVVTSPALETFTQDFTAEARAFIEQSVFLEQPFFLFMSHTNIHVPLAVSPAFDGITGRGLLADSLFELDWSVGELLDALVTHGVEDETLVVFVSDNGACNGTSSQVQQNHPLASEPERWVCGSNAPFSGYKGKFSEGGVRVPCLVRWPDVVPAGVTRETLGSLLDLLPTFVNLAGGSLPHDRVLDGEDLFPIWLHDAERVRDELHFYSLFYGALFGTRELHATRRGALKQFFDPGLLATQTFDLLVDPGETTPLSDPVLAASVADTGRGFDCSLDAAFEPPSGNYLSLNAVTTTSSSVDCHTSSQAVDGDLFTWWRSEGTREEWLELDLGAVVPVADGFVLWGPAGADAFSIEVSKDGVAWHTVHERLAPGGGLESFEVARRARYLRLVCAGGRGADVRELRCFAPPAAFPSSAK